MGLIRQQGDLSYMSMSILKNTIIENVKYYLMDNDLFCNYEKIKDFINIDLWSNSVAYIPILAPSYFNDGVHRMPLYKILKDSMQQSHEFHIKNKIYQY
jgi:hypothetical protein